MKKEGKREERKRKKEKKERKKECDQNWKEGEKIQKMEAMMEGKRCISTF